MNDEQSRAYCERIFAVDLAGQPLISNGSIWRNFPLLYAGNWVVDNVTLIGDALRTGHFSIGSGTRLACEDAIGLARALDESHDVPMALERFQSARKPIVDKIVSAANLSSFWYERLSDKMQMDPWDLAYDYMRRSGRMSEGRLRETAPLFMAAVDARRADGKCSQSGRGSGNTDAVSRDREGTRGISLKE